MYTALNLLVQRFRRGEDGAALAEYALIIALVALAAIGALTALGGDISSALTGIGQTIEANTPDPS